MSKILNAYTKDLKKILNIKDIECCNYLTDLFEYEELVGDGGTEYYIGDDQDDGIVNWYLDEMPGCCGILIMSGLDVAPKYRNKGVGVRTVKLIESLARKMDYKMLLATDLTENKNSSKMLKNRDWRTLSTFTSRKTGNKINLYSVIL